MVIFLRCLKIEILKKAVSERWCMNSEKYHFLKKIYFQLSYFQHSVVDVF